MIPLLPLLWRWGLSLAQAQTLPEGWLTAPPPIQTFAAEFAYHNYSSCSQSWSNYTVQAAVTLSLAADGTAQACREHRANDHNPDGWYIYADLQSMSGHYTREGDWIQLTLTPDGTTRCGEPRSTYHALRPWSLRCTWATPPTGARAPDPLLLCQFTTSIYSESIGLHTTDLLSGEWMPLGSAPGLSMTQDVAPFPGGDHASDAQRLQIAPLAQPPTIGTRIQGLIFSSSAP